MKLCSKNALLLSGMYGGVAIPLAYTSNELFEIIADILFGIFVIGNILLCLNKTPRFLTIIRNKFPQVSYYLENIGWIPYFVLLCLAVFICCGYVVNYTEEQMEWLVQIFRRVFPILFLVSFLTAFYKYKRSHP